MLTINNAKPLIPFNDSVMEFLNELSLMILQNKECKEYSDIVTFAFWCRKASLTGIKEQYKNDKIRLGRGIVFHITPSNVPINFAYSLVAGLLAGNLNIVKVSSKEFKQVDLIRNCISKLLENEQFNFLSDYINIIKYANEKETTDYISNLCDVRIIWGGDDTINEIRKSLLKPKAFDVTFTDRYSICLINADKYINEEYSDLESPIRIGKYFYNDVYLFDQNACTSPHLILWYGNKENIEKAKNTFWSILYDIVKDKYEIQPSSVIDKYTALCDCSIKLSDITIESLIDNRIMRIKLETLPEDIDTFKQHSGYFFEYTINKLDDLSNIINRKYQTLSYYGFKKEQLEILMLKISPLGIDRIVPIGKSLDFSLTWDGYDLINSLSRELIIL